jgi:hypothetical protein
MKYIFRILMLPFILILLIFLASIKWIRYGGKVRINLSEQVINPKELVSLLKDLNRNIHTLIEEIK